jgi:ABC-type multidrug transport system ATPase subunit
MLRRLGIAMAIVARPQVILLDEPTAGLDPAQRVAFREMVNELGERSTVVLATHLIEDVVASCSEVTVLAEGLLKYSGTPNALCERFDVDSFEDAFIEVTKRA